MKGALAVLIIATGCLVVIFLVTYGATTNNSALLATGLSIASSAVTAVITNYFNAKSTKAQIERLKDKKE